MVNYINYLKESVKNKKRSIDYDTGIINRYGDYRYMNYTHCEIHRWTMLGEISSGVPFLNHNYGTKSINNFSKLKQGVSLYLTNYKDRMDLSQVLYYPQRPIAITEGMKTDKKILIMTPASLRTNYLEELKKCGDILYKKNQYWEFIKTKDNPELVQNLSFVLSLSINYISSVILVQGQPVISLCSGELLSPVHVGSTFDLEPLLSLSTA